MVDNFLPYTERLQCRNGCRRILSPAWIVTHAENIKYFHTQPNPLSASQNTSGCIASIVCAFHIGYQWSYTKRVLKSIFAGTYPAFSAFAKRVTGPLYRALSPWNFWWCLGPPYNPRTSLRNTWLCIYKRCINVYQGCKWFYHNL